jgi:hypothetical protein
MHAKTLRAVLAGSFITVSSTVPAQNVPPGAVVNDRSTADTDSDSTGATPGPGHAPSSPAAAQLPPVSSPAAQPTPALESANSEQYPDRWSDPAFVPRAVSPEWHFSTWGFFRAPLRVGMGSRPPCPPGLKTPVPVVSPTSVGGQPYSNWYCALPNQSQTTFHSPYIPDDQYLGWTFDRTWEKAWTELYLSYGTNQVLGTVGLAAYDFTDTSLLGGTASPAEFGIYQGWVTLTPTLPEGVRVEWKVGAFDEKFGMARRTNGGAYDTYMFGRTHQMGEALAAELDLGDFTLKAEHGFGAHLEMVSVGTPPTGSPLAQAHPISGESPLLGASPGYTLLNHVHLGVTWKQAVQVNVHYLLAWSEDDRVQATLANPSGPTGSIGTYGVEARALGGGLGEIYAAYSHICATNATLVGPAYEVVHSSGGGGHNGANGIYENFFNASGNGDGDVDNLQVGYTVSIGELLRTLNVLRALARHRQDVTLAVFGLYSAVSNTDPGSVSPYNGRATDGTRKIKYGADLEATPSSWFGVGVRGDYIAPDSHDSSEAFGVITPRLFFRTRFVTHEEIILQYSHYWDGDDVIATQSISSIGYANIGHNNTGLYPNDLNVFGIKALMAW